MFVSEAKLKIFGSMYYLVGIAGRGGFPDCKLYADKQSKQSFVDGMVQRI